MGILVLISLMYAGKSAIELHTNSSSWVSLDINPVDISGTVVDESPDCLLLSGTTAGENLDHVCWEGILPMINSREKLHIFCQKSSLRGVSF